MHPTKLFERLAGGIPTLGLVGSSVSSGLHLSRLVCLISVVMLLIFASVFRLTDAGGVHAFWPEVALALSQLAALAASYRVAFVRRHFAHFIRLFSYLTAGLFIALAAANGFGSNYAVGLLFIIPGLGTGYGVASRDLRSLVLFFVVTAGGASAAALLTAGVSASIFLFIASLISISLVTTFVAAGWLDARNRYLASEERYRAVVEQASDGIFVLDAHTFEILDANPAFCEMVGASLSDLRSGRLERLFVSTRGEPIQPEHFRGGRSHRIECAVRRTDGSLVFGELKIDRIRHDVGDVLSVVVHDITSRKQYEERLVRAKEQAEEIARFKSSLLANMSHELRTPLSSIIGWTSVLCTEVPDRQRELVKLIECSGKRLHNTLDAVLELAHLHANAKEVSPTVVDVNEEIRQVAERVRAEVEGKGLCFELRLGARPLWAEVDPGCLHSVLMHVLDNAIKFTEEGSVSVSAVREGAELALSVTDTGIGMSREFMDSMFDEFKQESAGLNRDHEGSGLGLSIVRRLTDLLNGRVNVTSERRVGTTFTVYLPEVAASRRRNRR